MLGENPSEEAMCSNHYKECLIMNKSLEMTIPSGPQMLTSAMKVRPEKGGRLKFDDQPCIKISHHKEHSKVIE